MKTGWLLFFLLVGCASTVPPGFQSFPGDTTVEYTYKDHSVTRAELQKLDDCVYSGNASTWWSRVSSLKSCSKQNQQWKTN